VRRMLRWGALGLLILAGPACATGRLTSRAETAAQKGDWDTAVAYYREALNQAPSRLDLRVALQHALEEASSLHLKRARDLEAQDQLPGAAAEYHLAADLDPSNSFALSKALEIEKTLRAQAEANRPPSRMDELSRQAAQTSTVPHLDLRQHVNATFPRAAVRDILKSLADSVGLTITYDANLQTQLGNPYEISFTDKPIEEAIAQVLSNNQLAFKITGPREIFVFADTPTNHQNYDDTYYRTFYISHAEPNDIIQVLQQVTTQNGPTVRPVIQPVKSANAIAVRATAPVMDVIDKIIKTMDKPHAEVMIEVEVLEVDRTRMRQLGIDLSNYALGFTLSPELAPANTANPGFPPASAPPPFSLNSISHGLTTNDVYMNVPTAQIQLLESDQKTRLLAKPQLLGREGQVMTLNLGDQIPVIQTNLLSTSAGGVPTVPQQQINYRSIGVNLSVTPRVSYQDEIFLDSLTIDKSGLGGTISVGGADYSTFVDRTATVNLELRDGESTLLAGLIRDEDTKNWQSLPGILHLPILRSIFGNSQSNVTQTDIVMIVTPHIVRSHELTVDDLKPLPLGSAKNFGMGGVPTLISSAEAAASQTPASVPLVGPVPGGAPPVTGSTAGQPPVTAPPPPATPPAGAATTGNARVVGVVPVQAVPNPAEAPKPPAGAGQLLVSTPGSELALSGGPYAVPVQIANVSQVGAVAITLTYNPAVLRATVVNQGTFMQQGGTTTTFVPKIDAAAGRVDIAISRTGASGANATAASLLAAVMFQPVAAGTSQITLTGAVTSVGGQPIAVQTASASVVVK